MEQNQTTPKRPTPHGPMRGHGPMGRSPRRNAG